MSQHKTLTENSAKMSPEVKAKWVAALRSGKYQQERNALTNYVDQKSGDPARYCCLGVLCVIAVGADSVDYDTVRKLGVDEATQGSLSGRNDGRGGYRLHSFAEIADYIEANL